MYTTSVSCSGETLTVNIVLPTTNVKASRLVTRPQSYLIGDILSAYKVKLRAKGESTYSTRHLVKLGASVFMCLTSKERLKLLSDGVRDGCSAFTILDDVSGKQPMYVYEITPMDSIYSISEKD